MQLVLVERLSSTHHFIKALVYNTIILWLIMKVQALASAGFQQLLPTNFNVSLHGTWLYAMLYAAARNVYALPSLGVILVRKGSSHKVMTNIQHAQVKSLAIQKGQ